MRTPRTLATFAIAALLLTACGADTDDEVAVDDVAEESPDVEDEPDEVEEAEDPADEPAEDHGADTDPDEELPAEEETETAGPGTSDSPEPDEALLADPCAPHEDREMELFIELASPVQDQVASGAVALVGCSNVNEATVAWELYDGDGRLLDEGFTTAACGTGCVGAFEDEVPLDAAAGEPVAYLQVFSPNMSDEGDRQLALVEVLVVLGS
ncbi:MAG: Gmad2 immunoglobulin-like domain-containing protein [Nitriliruptoraceae bacterium]|nr:Gmad2 immunoglobulin-like domain-containing protein [Nitriliruptoraceae bacterium]